VHHVRRRRADAGLAVLLGGVERAPFRPTVDLVLFDDQATVLTDCFAVFGVRDDVAAAFGTGLYGFLLG
jgi:hypothetical protein